MRSARRATSDPRESQAAFAARHGLSRAKLLYSMRRVSARDGATSGGFQPVRLLASEPMVGVVEITLADGSRVVVRDGAPPAVIAQVLAALRSC